MRPIFFILSVFVPAFLLTIFLANTAFADLPLSQEIEPNGTFGTANSISSGGVIEARIQPNADEDFFSFNAMAGDRVYAATMTAFSSNSNVNSVLDLIASDGSTIIETDENDGVFGSQASSIAGAVIPSTGVYYLKVRNREIFSQLLPYRLFLQVRSGSPTAESEPNDTAGQANLPVSRWVSGDLSSALDVDIYDISLNAGDTVYLSLDSEPARDAIEWNGALGIGALGSPADFISADDSGSEGPDSEAFFMTVKNTGTFSLRVSSGATFGNYHLSVTVLPAVTASASCTTYTSTDIPQAIPDPGQVSSTITVPGNPRIADIDVSIQLNHARLDNLDVSLVSPAGNDNTLFTDIGDALAVDMDIVLDDEAALPAGRDFLLGSLPASALKHIEVQPESNSRLSWFDGQNAGGTWSLVLRDDAAVSSGTLTGWSITICEPPAKQSCPSGHVETTVYATDFESGAAGFTHSGTKDEWELGLPSFAPIDSCNSGTSCWKTDLDGDYEGNANFDLLSQNVDLSGLVAPIYINWSQKYQFEEARYDRFFVAAQEAGGANAVRMFDWDGPSMWQTIGEPGVLVEGSAGWGNYSGRADSLAGLVAEIRFNVATDGSVARRGLAVDDVSITACRLLSADLAITKTNGVATVVAGGATTYTIVASNAGIDSDTGATVTDTFPAALTCSWTCVGAGGGTCTAAGSGNINDSVNLPSGGSVTYTASCNVSAAASGSLANTATITSSISDPTPANNLATDTDTLLVDTDGDGDPDSTDPDDDNDGVTDVQEGIDGTNPLDPGSAVPVLPAEFCSEWNSFLGMRNVNEYANAATANRNLDIMLYNLDGVAQSMTGTSVLASSQRDVLIHDLTGFAADSYGRTCTDVSNGAAGDVDGRTVWYRPAGAGFDFAISLPYSGGKLGSQFVPLNTYHPSLLSANFVANWVVVTNDSSSSATGKVYYYAQDGSVLGTQTATIAAGGRRDFSAHQFGANRVGLVEWRPSNQTSKWVVRNIRYYFDNTTGALSFNSAMQIEGAKATGEAIVVPLDKRSGTAVLELSNATNAAITVAATFRNANGSVARATSYNLPAYSTIHEVADSILSTDLGSVTLDGSAVGSVIAVGAHYSRTGAELTNAYALFSREAKGSVLRSSYNTFLGQSCDLILVNSTGADVTSSVTMTRFDGLIVANGVMVTTPANGVTNYDLCANDTANKYGAVVVQPAVADSISGAVVRHGAGESYQFATELRQ